MTTHFDGGRNRSRAAVPLDRRIATTALLRISYYSDWDTRIRSPPVVFGRHRSSAGEIPRIKFEQVSPDPVGEI